MQIESTHLTKKQFQEHISNNAVFYDYYELSTSLLFVCATSLGIIESILLNTRNKDIEYEILQKYPNKQPFEPGTLAELLNYPVIPIVLVGTRFQISVWQAATKIAAGTTKTYQELAQIIGNKKANRAVARALTQNYLAYIIPCHRIISKDGSLGGYTWGIEKKLALLSDEKKGNVL
jgi:O-6-methylguanine DNA methyltransferase